MNPSRSRLWLSIGLWPVRVASQGIRLTTFAVLSALEPVVRLGLTILALCGFATCILYRWLLHAPHFPLGQMLILSVSAAVLSVLYGLTVRALSL